MKKLISLCLALVTLLVGCTQVEPLPPSTTALTAPTEATETTVWATEETTAAPYRSKAEELLEGMSLREKIGQLFIVRPEALGGNETAFDDNTAAALAQYPVGGVAIFGKNIVDESQLTKLTGSFDKMFVAIDEEGGRVSRIAGSGGFDVPKYKSMGSLKTPEEALKAAQSIGEYLCKYGLNMNFAPVSDINSNHNNQVIGDRAFSNDKNTVADMVSSQLDGYHEKGIITSIKHFPGHGDTYTDTHDGLTILDKAWDTLLENEIVPFKANLHKADTVMVSHITVPSVTGNTPSSLSYEMTTGKLRNELGYDGVVITDSMEMGAIRKIYSDRDFTIMAIKAGADIVLMPYDLQSAFDGLLEAVQSGEISEDRIDQSVMRVLTLKEKYGILD